MADAPPRFITPEGFARFRAEYEALFASNGPRSSKSSHGRRRSATGRKMPTISTERRLREIDRRLSHLARIMKAAKMVDPAVQSTDQVRFGATVELADEEITPDYHPRRR